jgi:adenine deaminase
MSAISLTLQGNIVDVVGGRIFRGSIHFSGGRITDVIEEEVEGNDYILPGLIDAHVHIESSMLIPSEFARLAVIHGTVATVSDPHEIANVLGIAGVRFMIENGKKVPFRFYFGAPSCVPATSFETSGAALGLKETEELLQIQDIYYLSEMMNFPGVLFKDKEVMAKLALAKKYGKPVDGHAPGLTGENARKYVQAGISTDHECFSLEEATEKISLGMKVLIREGSAARNFDALAPLLASHPEMVMFCSDDRHPDDLARRHINDVIKRALQAGYDPISIIRACTLNPVKHYRLDSGLLQKNDPADVVVVSDLFGFNVKEVYISGELVSKDGKSLIDRVEELPVNHFLANKITDADLKVEIKGSSFRVIEALEGQLITNELILPVGKDQLTLGSDPMNDILKIALINRYQPAPPVLAFVKGFGLQSGAMASTVAHDSHNIIAVGTNDEDMASAINMLIDSQGGICCVDNGRSVLLPLPVAGLMSLQDGWQVSDTYEELNKCARSFGSPMEAPFMTLSFMALLVIPSLKISDKGLFDGEKFEFTSLFLDQI